MKIEWKGWIFHESLLWKVWKMLQHESLCFFFHQLAVLAFLQWWSCLYKLKKFNKAVNNRVKIFIFIFPSKLHCTAIREERKDKSALVIHLWKLLCGQMIFYQTSRFRSLSLNITRQLKRAYKRKLSKRTDVNLSCKFRSNICLSWNITIFF